MVITTSNDQAQGAPALPLQSWDKDKGTDLTCDLLGSHLFPPQPPASTSSFLSHADHVKALIVLILEQM